MTRQQPISQTRVYRVALLTLGGVLLWLAPVVFPRPAPSGQVDYRLTWAEATAPITTNLGYRVALDVAYSVTYSVELLACEHQHGPLAALTAWFRPAEAAAGHGDTALNPTQVEQTHVTSSHDDAPVALGSGTGDEPHYCDAFVLTARARLQDDPVGLPAELDLLGTSLYITGTYTPPGSTQATPFTLVTGAARGVTVPLTDGDGGTMRARLSVETPLTVTIHHDVTTLFDDIDFASTDSEVAAAQALRNLSASTRVTASLPAR